MLLYFDIGGHLLRYGSASNMGTSYIVSDIGDPNIGTPDTVSDINYDIGGVML
jgi:hypothetical protein